jgi:predicted  nucleic acid-binding Zn-ribbon protein
VVPVDPSGVGSYGSVDVASPTPEPDNPGLPRGLSRLLELQELDLSIGRLTARLRDLEGGEDLRAARNRLSQSEARLGELRLGMDAVSKEQGRLEGDVELLQRKIDSERRRLIDGSVANPRELQAIEAEVRNLEGRRSRAEDLLLEQMERWEDMEGKLKPLDAEEAEARTRLSEVEEGSARELVQIEQDLAARNAERELLIPAFDPELLELYEDLRQQKRGVGAAALVDDVCQACHQELSPMYLDRLKRSDGIRRCEYCRRILIY